MKTLFRKIGEILSSPKRIISCIVFIVIAIIIIFGGTETITNLIDFEAIENTSATPDNRYSFHIGIFDIIAFIVIISIYFIKKNLEKRKAKRRIKK